MIGFIFSTWGALIIGAVYLVVSFVAAVMMMKSLAHKDYSVLSSKNGEHKYEPDDRYSHHIESSDAIAARCLLMFFMVLWPLYGIFLLFKYLFLNPLFNVFVPKAIDMIPKITIKVDKENKE